MIVTREYEIRESSLQQLIEDVNYYARGNKESMLDRNMNDEQIIRRCEGYEIIDSSNKNTWTTFFIEDLTISGQIAIAQKIKQLLNKQYELVKNFR